MRRLHRHDGFEVPVYAILLETAWDEGNASSFAFPWAYFLVSDPKLSVLSADEMGGTVLAAALGRQHFEAQRLHLARGVAVNWVGRVVCIPNGAILPFTRRFSGTPRRSNCS